MTDMGRVAAVVARRANGGFRDSKILPRMAEMASITAPCPASFKGYDAEAQRQER